MTGTAAAALAHHEPLPAPPGRRWQPARILLPPDWERETGHAVDLLDTGQLVSLTLDGAEPYAYQVPMPYLVHGRGVTVLGNPMALLDGDRLLIDGMLDSSRHAIGLTRCIAGTHGEGRVTLEMPAAVPEIDGPAVLIGGGPNFGHNLLDWGSRIGLLEDEAPELRHLPHIVSTELDARGYEVLHALGMWGGAQHVEFVAIPPDGALRVGELYAPSLTHAFQHTAPRHVRYVRELFYVPDRGRGPGRRLFLSRRGCAHRRLLNEDDVVDRLGFERIDPARLSFADQIGLFAEAACIAGPLGAATAATILAPADCGVVEIVHEDMRMPQYAILAALIGQPHRQVVGRKAAVNTTGINLDWDFTADPAAVEAAIAAVMEESACR